MTKIYKYLLSLTKVNLVLVILAAMLVFNFVYLCIVALLLNADLSQMGTAVEKSVDLTTVLINVVFGPIIETIIFQVFLIWLIKRFYSKSNLTAIIFSSIIFGLAHYSSLHYILRASGMGVLLAICFEVGSRKGKSVGIYATFLVHSIWNLFSFSLRHWL